MLNALRVTVSTLVIAVLALFIGGGCSQDSTLNSTGSANNETIASLALMPSDAVAAATTTEVVFVETFDHHSNVGNWSYFGDPDNRIEIIEKDGGNPGAFLHATCDGLSCLDTYAPKLKTAMGETSIFTGNYRTKGVTALGVDLATFGPEIVTTGGRPLCLILINNGGTPEDWSDDVQITYIGKVNIPMDNDNFRPYHFKIPSQSLTLPEDWQIIRGTGDNDADWNKVISDVSQVMYHYGDPFYFFMYQQWELGVDNVSITMEG